MSLINTVAPSDASGPMAETYQAIRQAFGIVPNALVLLSATPWQLERRWQNLSYYEAHPRLGGALRTAMRLRVARSHQCRYCIGVNEMLLQREYGWRPEQIVALEDATVPLPLPEREQVMLDFISDAVAQPRVVSSATIDALRAAGWADSDILDALCYAGEALVSDLLIDAFKVEMEAS